MPRNIPPALDSHLNLGGTSLCELIVITPVVGSVLAFTSHTQNINVGGVLHLSRPGMRVSVVKSNIRMEIDNSEGAGFFQTGVITLGDVLRGKFNDAFFQRAFANYDSPGDGGYVFQSGYVGRVQVRDHLFSAELRSLLAVISQPVGRILSRRCDVRRLGDARCKFDMSQTQAGTGVQFRQNLTVTGVVSQIEVQTSGMNLAGSNGSGYDDWFRGGIVHWLSGNNAGYESEISSTVPPAGLRLFNPPGLDIQAGDTLYAEAGCDRSMGHCEYKFRGSTSSPNGNLLNFRGFPFLIGDDIYRAGDALVSKPIPGEGI